MPIATGYTLVPPQTLPIVIAPVDSIAVGAVIMPTVTLGGHLLNSPVTDANGIAWILNAIDGWDAPDVRLVQTPRGNDTGLFNERSFYGGRLLICRGTFATSTGSASALMAARELLHSAVNIVGDSLSPLVVSESPPKMVMVKRMPGTKDHATSPVTFDFEVHLLAPDPRKYDPTVTTVTIPANVTATVVNNGTIEARPVLTVQGPAYGVFASNLTTGQNLLFGAVLGASDVFVVDLDFKSATLNGSPAAYTVASPPSQWWSLVPGANNIQFITTGTGTMQVSYRSAWV